MKRPRMIEWFIIAALGLGIIYLLTPQNIPVVIYKLLLVSVAGAVGYRIDRGLFPYARPHLFKFQKGEELLFAAAQLRRAIVVGAVIVAVAVGL